MAYTEQVVDDCYHEAAHAVFWHHADVEITELYVYGEGKIRTEWPLAPAPGRALDLAAGCLAGPLSVDVMRGRGLRPMPFDTFLETADVASSAAGLMGSAGFAVNPNDLRAIMTDDVGDDYEDALAMLNIGLPQCGELEACYEAVIERVDRGFEQWWEEILAVAEALMEAGRLDGPEAVGVIEAAARGGEGGGGGTASPSDPEGGGA